MQLDDKAFNALARALGFGSADPVKERHRMKLIKRNMRLERTLKAIAETPQPPNPLDAADRLDRVKRRAATALKIKDAR